MSSQAARLQYLPFLTFGWAAACGLGAPPEAPTTWELFGESLVEAAREADVDFLVEILSFSDPAIGDWFIETALGQNPNLEYSPPAEKPRASKIREDYREHVELFLRSYEDLFSGELVRVTPSPAHDLEGIDSRSVVIWLSKDGLYHGVYIAQAVETALGYQSKRLERTERSTTMAEDREA